MKPFKLPEVISEDDLIRILQATDNPKHKLAFPIAFYQALRVSEVVNLKPEHIKKSEHMITIKQGKGKKDRNIPIIKPLKIKPNSYIYGLNKLPVGLGVRALQIAFKQKAKDVLNKDLHFHCLRHSGASWLLNKKRWNTRQLQRFLGHSKLQTTEIYLHVNAQDLVDLEWGDEDIN